MIYSYRPSGVASLNMPRFIKISGLSGSGKSTVCKELKRIPGFNAYFIHQDDYFKKEKPMIVLSNGVSVRNWDCREAIDFDRLNKDVSLAMAANDTVILEGFMLRDNLIQRQADEHIHLSYMSPGETTSEASLESSLDIIISRTLESRSRTKRGAKYEDLMIREVILPTYKATLHNSTITHVIYTFDDSGKRIDCHRIVDEVKRLIGV